jgi:hypothetical protein
MFLRSTGAVRLCWQVIAKLNGVISRVQIFIDNSLHLYDHSMILGFQATLITARAKT